MPGLLGTFPTWVGMQTETTNKRISKIRKLLDMLSAKEKRIMGQGELRPPQGRLCVLPLKETAVSPIAPRNAASSSHL